MLKIIKYLTLAGLKGTTFTQLHFKKSILISLLFFPILIQSTSEFYWLYLVIFWLY